MNFKDDVKKTDVPITMKQTQVQLMPQYKKNQALFIQQWIQATLNRALFMQQWIQATSTGASFILWIVTNDD